MAINVIVQHNDRSLPDNLLLTQAPIIVVWFDATKFFMFCYVWWLCMAINISVQYNGGLLPDIILLTQGYYPRGTRLNTMFVFTAYFFLFFFSFIPLIADGPHHYHPACGHKGSSHLSPVHALHFFYRDASSALLQLVNQWLNFTYSRSHAFRYERKNTNPTSV